MIKKYKTVLGLLTMAVCLVSCGKPEKAESGQSEVSWEPETQVAEEPALEMQEVESSYRQIRVQDEAGNIILFELNESTAAEELYQQLPLTVEIVDYSTNEKVFYLAAELDTQDAPMAEAGAGTLAYYGPWEDVVLFYDGYSPNEELYELGQAVEGAGLISELSGVLRVTAVDSGYQGEVLEMAALKPEEYVIPEFPLTLQNPELPTGCEITAMTMVLNYYGYPVDKVTMALSYLPCASPDLYYGSDGRLYGTDLNNYFIGDPSSIYGYICGTGAIITAANTYLEECGSSLRAVDISGTPPEELYALVSREVPVVVWVTIEMENRRETEGWYTESGEYVDWSTNDHGAVLIGYSENTVTIADPISGQAEYSREAFEQVFTSRGNQCVILEG